MFSLLQVEIAVIPSPLSSLASQCSRTNKLQNPQERTNNDEIANNLKKYQTKTGEVSCLHSKDNSSNGKVILCLYNVLLSRCSKDPKSQASIGLKDCCSPD